MPAPRRTPSPAVAPGAVRTGHDDRRPRRAVLLAAFAVGLAIAGCGPSVDPEPSGQAPVVVAPSLPSVASGITQAGVPRLVNVGFADGVVTGAVGTVRLAQNTPVRLTVLTDTADILLVQGYQLRAQLTVDEPVQLAFIAGRKGSYDVVLEGSGRVLTTLQVD